MQYISHNIHCKKMKTAKQDACTVTLSRAKGLSVFRSIISASSSVRPGDSALTLRMTKNQFVKNRAIPSVTCGDTFPRRRRHTPCHLR